MSENEVLRRKVDWLQTQITRATTPLRGSEMDQLADAQTRADGVYTALGERVPPAGPGEGTRAYRERLAAKLQRYSPQFKGTSLGLLDDLSFDAVEGRIYNDAMLAATRPDASGGLRAVTRNDGMGHTYTEYHGDNGAFLAKFKPPVSQRVRMWASPAPTTKG